MDSPFFLRYIPVSSWLCDGRALAVLFFPQGFGARERAGCRVCVRSLAAGSRAFFFTFLARACEGKRQLKEKGNPREENDTPNFINILYKIGVLYSLVWLRLVS